MHSTQITVFECETLAHEVKYKADVKVFVEQPKLHVVEN